MYFEDNEKLNLINKAEDGKDKAIGFMINVRVILCFYVAHLIFMSWFLFQQSPVLVVVIAATFISPVIDRIFRAHIFRDVEEQSALLKRECDHYEQCVCGRKFFAETRHLGAFGYFFSLCKRILAEINVIVLKASNKSNLFGLCMQMITAATYIGVWVTTFFMVLNNPISVGAIVTILASLDDVCSLVYFLVSGNLPELFKVFGAIENYIEFMDLPETGENDDETEVHESIVFDKVSFPYPNADRKAVSDVSFRLNHKEKIAIVGENGSGKTTLMRLLTGIYKNCPHEKRQQEKRLKAEIYKKRYKIPLFYAQKYEEDFYHENKCMQTAHFELL